MTTTLILSIIFIISHFLMSHAKLKITFQDYTVKISHSFIYFGSFAFINDMFLPKLCKY